jgi:hypothetical protein
MIDELDLVRRFRADEPDADDDTVMVARAALTRATAAAALAPGAPRRHHEARAWRLRCALAVAAVAIAMLAVWPFGSGGGPSVSPALAATLNRLAQIAASGPSLVPHRGEYLYVASASNQESDTIAKGKECVTYAPERRQVWIGADGSGLLRESSGTATFTSAADRSLCDAMPKGAISQPGTSNLWFAPHCFSIGPNNDVNALSTDPRTLLVQMRRADGGPRSTGEDFVHVGDFLRETDARPALRAALYRAAALIPGVRLLGTVRDHLGREGLGVAYSKNELIFNPRTAALLAEQTIGHPGWTVYLASRVVNRLPRRSPLPLTPPCVNYGGYITHTPAGDVQTGARPH